MFYKRAEYSLKASNKGKRLKINNNKSELIISNDKLKVVFDLAQGNLKTYNVGGVDFVQSSPYTNFWRAPIDNDYGNNLPLRSQDWKIASNNRDFADIKIQRNSPNEVEVIVLYKLPNIGSTNKILSLIHI